MKYLIVLFAGLIIGFFAGELRQKPTPAPTLKNIENLKPTASPFAPIVQKTPATETRAVEAVSPALIVGNTSKSTLAPLATIDLGNLERYDQLTAFFAQLETADTEQLQQLASQLRSEFQQNYDSPYYNAVATAVYLRWADIDFDAALDSLANIKSAMHGPEIGIHMNMLQVLAKERPERIQSWVQTQNRAVKDMVQYTVYASMAMNDPRAMAQQALESNTPESEAMLDMAMTQWSIEDPAAAWQFIQSTANPKIHQRALEAILRTWVDSDVHGALPILEQLINDSTLDSLSNESYTDIYLSALARTDPQSALDYISSQTVSDHNFATGHSAIYELANQHPELLQSWLQQMPAEQMEQLGPMAVMPLIETQAMNDPQAAMEMIDMFPQAREIGMRNMVLDQWLMTDSTGAIEWLKAQPTTEENQQAVKQAALTLIYSAPNPATGLSLIEQFSLPVDEQLAVQIAHTISEQDPQLAHTWFSQNTDPATYAIASIAIDTNDGSIPTEQILQKIDSADSYLQPIIVMELLHSRARDRDAVVEWLDTTSTMPEAERAQLKAMFGSGGAGASMYIQNGNGLLHSSDDY